MFDTRAPCNVVKSTERRFQHVEHILGKVDRRAGIRLTEVAKWLKGMSSGFVFAAIILVDKVSILT